MEADRYANEDASSGRMVELIERGQPALMLCHWPGMYCQGTKAGFHAFQRIVTSLQEKYGDRTRWMKLSEIARYWASKEHAVLERGEEGLAIETPFACPDLTVEIDEFPADVATLTWLSGDKRTELTRVDRLDRLEPNTFHVTASGDQQATATICLTHPQGETHLRWTR